MIWSPIAVEAQNVASIVNERQKNIDTALKAISEAESGVVKALEKARSPDAVAGDPQPWRELAGQMSRYTQTVDGNLQVIDDNMKIILEADPGAVQPIISLKSPLGDALQKVRERKSQIEKAYKELQNLILNVDAQIADITRRIVAAAQSGTVDTVIGGLLPDSITDLVLDEGGGLAMTLAWTLGATTLGGVLAAGLVLKKGWDFYKASTEVAQKIKALEDIREALLRLKKMYQELVESLEPALTEAIAIEADLTKHGKEIERLQQKAVTMTSGWQRRAQVFETVEKEKYEPPAPPASTASPYAGPSLDYGEAKSESRAAWQDLLDNKIDGATYRLRVEAAKNGAAKKCWENMEPYRQKSAAVADQWNKALEARNAQWPAIAEVLDQENKDPRNFYWNPISGVIRISNTPGMIAFWKHRKEGEEINNRFMTLTRQVGAEYARADASENKAYTQCITTIDTERADREKAEGANLASFYDTFKKWESFEWTRKYSEYGAFGDQVNITIPLRQIGWSGESLGWAAWEGTFRFPAVTGGMKSSSVAGPLKGAVERYAEWQKGVKETVSDMREIFSSARSQESTASGLASEADSMGSKVAERVEAWLYLNRYANYMDAREVLKRLKNYKPIYELLSEENGAQAEAYLKDAEKFGDDASTAASLMAQAPSVLDAASRTVKYRDAVFNVLQNNNIGSSGGLIGVLSGQYGINQKMLAELESMIAGFASEDKLKAYVSSILPLQQAYGVQRNKVLTKREIEDIRKQLRSQAAKIARARDDYAEAYSQMAGAEKELDGKLVPLKAAIAPIFPAQLKFLSKRSVLDEVASEGISEPYLPDPAKLPDLLEGVENLLTKYIELSEKYYALVTPMLERLKKEPTREIQLLEKLAKRVDEQGAGWLALEGNKFTKKWNEISSQAHDILTSRPDVPSTPGSALNKAYFSVMAKLDVLQKQFYRKFIIHKIPAIVEELRVQIAAVTKFLKAPDKNGGTPAAISWRQKLESLIGPGSDADSLKSEPEVVPLVAEISKLIVKIQALAQREDELAWLRTSCRVEGARLNGEALTNAMGQTVVLTKNDLKSGAVEITFGISAVDKIDALLISEDNGKSWKGISKSQNVTYSFVPQPNQPYQPRVKMKTAIVEIESEIFPGVSSIQYRDIDFMKLVAETLKKLADAYEQQNVSIFSDCVSRDFLGNKTSLEEGVRYDFDTFNGIRLVLFINRIEKRGDQFAAEVKWNKDQTVRKTGRQQRTSGNTTMIFVFEDGAMKIKNLRGNLIYATLSPEIAEASGLGQSEIDAIRKARESGMGAQPGAGSGDDTGKKGGDGAPMATATLTTGTFTLTQYKLPHPPDFDIEGFNFKNQSKTRETSPFPVQADFRRREGWIESSSGVVDLGSVGIESVDEAPASGYAGNASGAQGHVFAVRLLDGTYALVETQSLADIFNTPNTSTFKYKYQRNGTRSFK
ncbi:MAG: hypothetical protein A2351_07965 [Omnitrophica bacterium RIFOXYB12_FULL_50_7]|nr:MAG: hypothetical protein A2351_07965 [Omnitrophica bacterium RIFOXYB12_FULL_50_7]